MLACSIGATESCCIELTADHDLERHDLQAVRHRVLDRRAAFPADICNEIYAYDRIGQSVLQQFKRRLVFLERARWNRWTRSLGL